MGNPPVGTWVEDWLSIPRFAVYVAAAGGDRGKGLALYEWNAQVTSAFHHDLAHIEVGLRNAYDRILTAGSPAGSPHWVFDPHRFFPPQKKRAAQGQTYDANETARRQIDDAVRKATAAPAGPGITPPAPPPGKVVAELNFGFFRYLTVKRQEHPLWIPHLHKAFPAGTARVDVDVLVNRAHSLRNRVAHHENLLSVNMHGRHHELRKLALLLSAELHQHLVTYSQVPTLLSQHP
ncbi:hypothetical protein D5S17_35880 [Pseudonocardiaceae bacterium YIM PH 21723]|nr:hypothetical protein D5S17_35880 [Pseudonocardiaceae bacterium YIM PH 21723]